MIGDIRKFKFWCQKVLPLVYDDSLSYYEVLCKVVTYLNNVIADVNKIPEYIDDVIDERLSDEHLQELIEQFVVNIESAISSNNEGDNTNSSTDYNISQMLWWNGKLYRVIRQIDAGDTFIVDTNIALVNFEDLFNDFVDEVKHDITANDDGSNPTATQSWPAGTWLWLNDVLYIVKSDITQGNAYVFSGDNANVEQITVEDEIKKEATTRANADSAMQTAISDETIARSEADTTLQNNIDAEALALQNNIDAEALAREQAINNAMEALNENTNIDGGDTASLMSYNSTPVNDVTRLSIVDGNNDNPSTSDNNPSVMINRVDDSYHGDTTKNTPQYILYDLYATMKRIATSCGYASSILGYMEDNTENGTSAGGSTQSVAVSGMAYVTKNSSVWALYGDVYNKSEGLANVQACELNVHNETGVDYAYNASNPVLYPFSCGQWIVTGGNADNSFALGISTFDAVNSHWHVGEYYAPFAVTDIGIDMQATPTINIKLHGAKTDPLSGINHQGIGIDFDGHYWQEEHTPEVGHGALHLHNEAICFGSTGLGHIVYNETQGALEFWYNGARRGYINMGGTDHEL